MKQAEIEVGIAVRGKHGWPSAPDNRDYLRLQHVHLFQFTGWARVVHDDRAIEFHDLEEDLLDYVNGLADDHEGSIALFGTRSCEQLARQLLDDMPQLHRVKVMEDDSVGAIVEREDQRRMERPPIVTLCGSTRFKDAFREAEAHFEREGTAVFTVGFFAHADGVPITESEKRAADYLHKQKIALSDFIYVVNPGGYIGESTRSEIDFAYAQGIPVRYWDTPL